MANAGNCATVIKASQLPISWAVMTCIVGAAGKTEWQKTRSLLVVHFYGLFLSLGHRSPLRKDIMHMRALVTLPEQHFTNTHFSFLKHNPPFGCLIYSSSYSSKQHLETFGAFLCKALCYSSLISSFSIFPPEEPGDNCLLSFTAPRHFVKLKC